MSGVASYGALLRLEHAKRMTVSGFFARLPISMNALAILLLVRSTAGHYTGAGIASGAYILASAVAAPYKGRVIDRVGVTRGVLPFAVAHAACLLAVVGVAEGGAPLPVVVAAATLTGATLPTLMPVARAVWAQMIEPSDIPLQSAYALEGSIQEGIFVAGPLGVGAAFSVWPGAGLVLAAAMTLGGSLVYCRTHPVRSWRTRARRGDGHALAAPGLRGLLALSFLTTSSYGILEVLLPAIARQERLGRLVGLLLAMVAVGSASGALAFGLIQRPYRPGRALAITAPVLVVATLPLAWAHGTPRLMAAAFLAGLPLGGFFIFVFMACGAIAIAGTEIESQTWLTTAIAGGIAVGTTLGGLLADHSSQRDAVLVCAALALVAALVTAGWRQGGGRTA